VSVKRALYSELSRLYRVTSLLGTNAKLKSPDLYLESMAPESATYPRVTMQVTQRDRMRHMTGSIGLVDGRVGLTISATTSLGADKVAEVIRLVFENGVYHQTTLGHGEDIITVSDIYIDNDFDNTLAPIDGSGSAVYQRIQELVIWYRESLT